MNEEKGQKTNGAAASEKSMGGWAFYPFLILIGIVVARIIYNMIIGVPQQGNSFPITAVTMVAAACSLYIGHGKVMDRVDAFSKGGRRSYSNDDDRHYAVIRNFYSSWF